MIPLLFNYIKHWWLGLNATSKVLSLLLILAIGYGIYTYSGKALYKYRYFKALETQVETLRDSILRYEIRVTNLIESGKKDTEKTKKQSALIDKKLKEDEETIDNSTISDDDIVEFITKHQKR